MARCLPSIFLSITAFLIVGCASTSESPSEVRNFASSAGAALADADLDERRSSPLAGSMAPAGKPTAGTSAQESTSESHEMTAGGMAALTEGDERPTELPAFENAKEIVIDAGDGIAIQPSVAFSTEQHMAAAWCASTDEDLGVWFGLWDADGEVMVPPFNLDTTQVGIQNEPTVCAQTSGGFVVVWSQDDQSGSDNLGIRFRRLDHRGQPIDAMDRVITTNHPGNHWLAHLACNNDGGFTVVGVFSEENETFGVFVQAFDQDGETNGPSRTLNDGPEGTQAYPNVSVGPGDWTQVVWQDTLNADSGTRAILARWQGSAPTESPSIIALTSVDDEVKDPVIVSLDAEGSSLVATTLNQRNVALYSVQADGRVTQLTDLMHQHHTNRRSLRVSSVKLR